MNANRLKVLSLALCFGLSFPASSNAAEIASAPSIASTNLNPTVTAAPIKNDDALEMDDDSDPEDAKFLLNGHGAFLGRSSSLKADKSFVLSIEPGTVLEGSVNNSDGDPFLNQHMTDLVKSALQNNEQMKKAEAAYQHFNTTASKSAAKSKDAINIVVNYRGFSSSAEAGDIILGEKLKLRNLAAAEWAKQKEVDDTQLAVANSIMDAAMGFGAGSEEQQLKMLMRAHKKLTELVGEDGAQDAINKLALWQKKLNAPKNIYDKELWAPGEQEDKVKALVAAASKRDAMLGKIEKSIHKYNHKSKAAMAAGSLIEGGLGAACLVPSFIGPGAQIALTAYEMATGGSEENKLLRQIYLGKRRESRVHYLERKAQLALHNYQLGKASHNLVLMAVSESILDEMAGESVSAELLGGDII